MRKKKTNRTFYEKEKFAILSALAMAGAAAAAGVAGTVAYFNSHSEIDVTVSAAKVDVEQTSLEVIADKTSMAYGSATVNGNKVVVSMMVPEDVVVIKASYQNKSNIETKYRLDVVAEGGVEVSKVYKDADFTNEVKLSAGSTSWEDLAVGAEVGDRYFVLTGDDLTNGGTASLTIGLDAVQSNAVKGAVAEDALDKGGEFLLAADQAIDSVNTLVPSSDLTVDLGGKTLTLAAPSSNSVPHSALTVEAGRTVVMKNGTLNVAVTDDLNHMSAASIWAKGKLVLDNVVVDLGSTGGLGITNGADVTIKNSTITSSGYFALSTNADSKYGVQNPHINIENCQISVSNSVKDNAALMVNNNAVLNVKDTKLTADRQCLIVRDGVCNLDHVTFDKTDNTERAKRDVADTTTGKFAYGTGHEVTKAELFVGNGDNNGYNHGATVNFKSACTFTQTDAAYNPIFMACGDYGDVALNTNGYYHGVVKALDFRSGDAKTFKLNGEAIEDAKNPSVKTIQIA